MNTLYYLKISEHIFMYLFNVFVYLFIKSVLSECSDANPNWMYICPLHRIFIYVKLNWG